MSFVITVWYVCFVNSVLKCDSSIACGMRPGSLILAVLYLWGTVQASSLEDPVSSWLKFTCELPVQEPQR